MRQYSTNASLHTLHSRECILTLRFITVAIVALFLCLQRADLRAETLQEHLKRLTSALSSRNLDSLRQLIDTNRISVEIAPNEATFLSPSQTLGVIESYFRAHPPYSFSYFLVKEEGTEGIAIGTLIVSDNGRKTPHRVNFGFLKNRKGNWYLTRISIR